MTEEIEPPGDWEEPDELDKHSTVSTLVEGYQHPDGTEVVIWEGEEDQTGDVKIKPHLKTEVPPSAEYVVEVLVPGSRVDELDDELFAKNIERAREKAKEVMEERQ